jgi:hypothetical protein
MYRILGEHEAVRERRDQLRHPQYRRPSCCDRPTRCGRGISRS